MRFDYHQFHWYKEIIVLYGKIIKEQGTENWKRDFKGLNARFCSLDIKEKQKNGTDYYHEIIVI